MQSRREFLQSSSLGWVSLGVPCMATGLLGGEKEQEVMRLDGSRIRVGDLEERVMRLMQAARIPGLCVTIFNRGQNVYLRGFGMRNVEARLPMTEDTVMYGASFTKAVFAYMVMQLVDERSLDLDKPVYLYLDKPLPEYEKYSDLASDERYKKITARMILSHTTGFPNFRFINPDNKLDIKFDPGTQYSYSGEGINLLGFVLEQRMGKSVGALMQARVFDRLQMTRTSMTWQPAFETNYAIGYDEQQRPLGHQRRTNPRAAGSMDTTISDYARFIEAVLSRRGLSAKSWKTMFTPQIRIHSKTQFPTPSKETTTQNDKIGLAYGLGWGVFHCPFGNAYFKEGHDDGWENHSVCFDHNKTALILMSNSSNGDSIYKELLKYLIGDTFTPWQWEGYIPYTK